MRLGEILIARKQITEDDLARALEIQRERSGDKLGKILVDLGFIAARDVLSALSEQLQVPVLAMDGPPAVSPETESLAPRFLRQFKCLPVALHDHTVTLAMADPLDFETRSAVGLPCRWDLRRSRKSWTRSIATTGSRRAARPNSPRPMARRTKTWSICATWPAKLP
jgi:hypothetical protein